MSKFWIFKFTTDQNFKLSFVLNKVTTLLQQYKWIQFRNFSVLRWLLEMWINPEAIVFILLSPTILSDINITHDNSMLLLGSWSRSELGGISPQHASTGISCWWSSSEAVENEWYVIMVGINYTVLLYNVPTYKGFIKDLMLLPLRTEHL